MKDKVNYLDVSEISPLDNLDDIFKMEEYLITEGNEKCLFVKSKDLPENYVWQFYQTGVYSEFCGVVLYRINNERDFYKNLPIGQDFPVPEKFPYEVLISKGIDDWGAGHCHKHGDLRFTGINLPEEAEYFSEFVIKTTKILSEHLKKNPIFKDFEKEEEKNEEDFL